MIITELQWAKELPTEAGWYLVWTKEDHNPDLVQIGSDPEGLYLATPYDEWLQNIEDCKGSDDLWYGPIPIPTWGVLNESTNSTLT